MNDDELMKLMVQVDPQTKRIPPGIRAIADAVEAAERERCAAICHGLTHALDHGGNAYRREALASQCAAAIRKG